MEFNTWIVFLDLPIMCCPRVPFIRSLYRSHLYWCTWNIFGENWKLDYFKRRIPFLSWGVNIMDCTLHFHFIFTYCFNSLNLICMSIYIYWYIEHLLSDDNGFKGWYTADASHDWQDQAASCHSHFEFSVYIFNESARYNQCLISCEWHTVANLLFTSQNRLWNSLHWYITLQLVLSIG